MGINWNSGASGGSGSSFTLAAPSGDEFSELVKLQAGANTLITDTVSTPGQVGTIKIGYVNQPGAVLEQTIYNPTTMVTQTVSTSVAQLFTPTVTFIAPPSGNGNIHTEVSVNPDAGNLLQMAYGTGTTPQTTYSAIDPTGEQTITRVIFDVPFTGLTPGDSYTWNPIVKAQFSKSSNWQAGGSNTIGGTTYPCKITVTQA